MTLIALLAGGVMGAGLFLLGIALRGVLPKPDRGTGRVRPADAVAAVVAGEPMAAALAGAPPATAPPASARRATAPPASAQPARARAPTAPPARAQPATAVPARARAATAPPASAQRARARPATARPATAQAVGSPAAGAPLAGHPVPEATRPVEVNLLGPVSVRAPGGIEPSRPAIATEIVAYLATHPGGVYPDMLAAAIWPEGVTYDVRDAAVAEVQRWLGTDGIGRPHVAADASGRLRLGSAVKVDWHVFLTLLAQAGQVSARGGGPAGQAGHTLEQAREEARLARALSLVTGEFLAGAERRRYAWVVTDGLAYEVAARVGDAAHRLYELRLGRGDPEGAMAAARAGLRLATYDELLWRDLLTAARATGQDHLVRTAVGEVRDRARADGARPEMAPETAALMDELMPAWRRTIG
jgi:hypothetical protein